MTRRYEDYGAEAAAAEILNDCIFYGVSTGWCGSNKTFDKVEKILNSYNVFYTCDFTGEWTHKSNQ